MNLSHLPCRHIFSEWDFGLPDYAFFPFSVNCKGLPRQKTNRFTPFEDCGDNVIIINAEKVVLTGNKLTDKLYTRHTGYPGGQRHTSPAAVLKVHPERVIEHAVRGMLPKNRLGRAVLKNLHLYAGTEHKHEAQQPKVIDLNSLN